MNQNFQDWQEFEASGASVPFYKKKEDGHTYIGFQTTDCTPPGPMVNALVALNYVNSSDIIVVMINHKFPLGLIPKIEDKFSYTREDLDDGSVKIVFILKDNTNPTTYNTDCSCEG